MKLEIRRFVASANSVEKVCAARKKGYALRFASRGSGNMSIMIVSWSRKSYSAGPRSWMTMCGSLAMTLNVRRVRYKTWVGEIGLGQFSTILCVPALTSCVSSRSIPWSIGMQAMPAGRTGIRMANAQRIMSR